MSLGQCQDSSLRVQWTEEGTMQKSSTSILQSKQLFAGVTLSSEKNVNFYWVEDVPVSDCCLNNTAEDSSSLTSAERTLSVKLYNQDGIFVQIIMFMGTLRDYKQGNNTYH